MASEFFVKVVLVEIQQAYDSFEEPEQQQSEVVSSVRF